MKREDVIVADEVLARERFEARARDGRRLVGSAFGPHDGRPVLFIAGAATGSSMSFGDEVLDAAGIRLLTMDRPGMGESQPDPQRTLASTADDYRAFVAHVTGAEPTGIPVVANSQGGVFGLAAALAGWVSHLVLASPADELAHPDIHAMLPAEATQLVDLARDDPDAAARILGAFTPAAMEAMVLEGSHERDRAFYASAGFRSRYRRALAEGFAQDGAGYVRDTLLAMRPWALPLEEVAVPVSILFGAEDRGHSPDLGLTLSRRIPGARRSVLQGAGGALLWTRPDAVRDAILAERGGAVRIRASRGQAEHPSLVRVWRSAVDATHDFLAERDRAEIERRLAPDYFPHVRLAVAERRGEPVGFAGTADGKLEMLFVDAACRGQGIGGALLEHAIAEHGVSAVDVNEQNEQAVGFYARAGFRVTGRSPLDAEGRPYPMLHMSLAR